jgi:hypothetical protein
LKTTVSDSRLADYGEIFSLRAGCALTPQEYFPVLISVRGWVKPRVIGDLEGLGKFKKKCNDLGIYTATFYLVA